MRADDGFDKLHSLLIHQTSGIGFVINSERFNTTYKLTTYVLKFTHLLRSHPQNSNDKSSPLQRSYGYESQTALLRDERFPTWKTQFSLFQDSRGLWRCRGRLQSGPFYTSEPPHSPGNTRCPLQSPPQWNPYRSLLQIMAKESCQIHHSQLHGLQTV